MGTELGVHISLGEQTLTVYQGGQSMKVFPVSTSKYGPGEIVGSFRTPRGRHIIRAKIGRGAPIGAIFVGRRFTGQILDQNMYRSSPERDWILTRILWLSGIELGFNRLNGVDTMRRYIYIHGCPDEEPVGEPRSHGCIRMRNEDVISVFDLLPCGTNIRID